MRLITLVFIVTLVLQVAEAATPDQCRKLYSAAEKGERSLVERLISQGADVNCADKNGLTALMASSYAGHVSVARLLIEKAANVNALDGKNASALMWAVKKTHLDVVTVLLNAGADPNVEDAAGMTPLMFSSAPAIAEALISKGADVNAKGPASATPLMLNAGFPSVLQVLINHGAEVNAINQLYRNALFDAVDAGNLESVKLLLSKGADFTIKDRFGQTVLQLAQENKQKQIATLLKQAGAKE